MLIKAAQIAPFEIIYLRSTCTHMNIYESLHKFIAVNVCELNHVKNR